MYAVSAAYKDWILTNPATRTFAIRASIVTPSGTVNLTDTDFVLGGLDISETLASGDTIEVGMTTMSEMAMTVYNNHAEYDTMQMRGSRVFVEIGYTLEDTSVEWVPMGRYIVTESSIPDSTITLRCSDYMLLTQRPWTDAIVTYPATIGEIIDAACLACALTVVDTTGIPNIDYSVTYDFLTYSKVTCRDVLGYCAQICGRNARMTRDGLLEFVWYGDVRQLSDAVVIDGNVDVIDAGTTIGANEAVYDAGYIGQDPPDYTLSPTHYERFQRDSGAVILSGLSYSNDGDTYTIGGTRYALQLEPNPLLQENVETALLTLWDAIGFTAYTPYTMSVFGDPARQAGDRVTIVDRDGVSYNTITTRVTHRFRGRQELRAVGRAQELSDWSSATSKALTQLLIQQRAETVRLTAYEQRMIQFGELVVNSTGLYRSEETQLDGSIIYYQHDAPTLAASTYIWRQSATAFAVSDDGGVSWHGLDAAGNMLTRVLNAIKVSADLVQTGRVESVDGKTWFDLDSKTIHLETTINSQAVVIEINPTNGLTMTVDGDNVGGLTVINGAVRMVARTMADPESATQSYVSFEPDPDTLGLECMRFFLYDTTGAAWKEHLRIRSNGASTAIWQYPTITNNSSLSLTSKGNAGNPANSNITLLGGAVGGIVQVNTDDAAGNTMQLNLNTTTFTIKKNGSALETWT